MTPPDYTRCPYPVRADIERAHEACWEGLASPGAHFTGPERIAIADVVRRSRATRGRPPWLRGAPEAGEVTLQDAAISAARTLAIDAHRVDRDWAARTVEALGAPHYVELTSIVAQVSAIDVFSDALGERFAPLPEPLDGSPTGEQAVGIGDVGAFVPMLADFKAPNVGRALSLVPSENQRFFGLVGAMYAMRDFTKLVWDRPLSRPQVELVAARVSAVNECFY